MTFAKKKSIRSKRCCVKCEEPIGREAYFTDPAGHLVHANCMLKGLRFNSLDEFHSKGIITISDREIPLENEGSNE